MRQPGRARVLEIVVSGWFVLVATWIAPALGAPDEDRKSTVAEALAAAADSDWEPIAPEDLLVMRVAGRDVVIELAPAFAPRNVENLRVLVSEGYFDGLSVLRSQDNYVVQWGDPEEDPDRVRSLGRAKERVRVELDVRARQVEMTPLETADPYAERVGFVDGFPVATDGRRTWLTHCYGMVGVARGNEPNSGNGASLYVVTGHAPRHLDRNITLVGRIIDNIDALSALPRGSGALGFYEGDDGRVPIESVRLVSTLPEADRPRWRRLRTDSLAFEALVAAQRTREEAWFLNQVGRIGLCNVQLPRSRPSTEPR